MPILDHKKAKMAILGLILDLNLAKAAILEPTKAKMGTLGPKWVKMAILGLNLGPNRKNRAV